MTENKRRHMEEKKGRECLAMNKEAPYTRKRRKKKERIGKEKVGHGGRRKRKETDEKKREKD